MAVEPAAATEMASGGSFSLVAGDAVPAPPAIKKTPEQLDTEYAAMVRELRGVFLSNKTQDMAWRRQQMEQLLALFRENVEEISAAVRKDLGGSSFRIEGEFASYENLLFTLENLDEFTGEQHIGGLFHRRNLRQEPKGVALIIAPWNLPFDLSLTPLGSAIAAGNCVVLKPSELAAHSSACMARLIPKYLDNECFKVIEGAVPETTALLNQFWDHIFFTGSGMVGKVVYQSAVKNLTTCTLELGGKSPCIVDTSYVPAASINRIGMAKWFNCGQICVAPDYCLVQESIADDFIAKLVECAKIQFGDDPKSSEDYGRIINVRNTDRLKHLIDSTTGTVVMGGSATIDREERYVPPTIIKDAGRDDPVMQEEIFGPVLVVLTYKSLKEVPEFVNSRDKPLAMYIHSTDSAAIKHLLTSISSGMAVVNTVVEQGTLSDLPFGGVGASGMGAGHGRWGVEQFSKYRGTFYKSVLPGFRGTLLPMPIAGSPLPKFVYPLYLKMKFGILPAGAQKLLRNHFVWVLIYLLVLVILWLTGALKLLLEGTKWLSEKGLKGLEEIEL